MLYRFLKRTIFPYYETTPEPQRWIYIPLSIYPSTAAIIRLLLDVGLFLRRILMRQHSRSLIPLPLAALLSCLTPLNLKLTLTHIHFSVALPVYILMPSTVPKTVKPSRIYQVDLTAKRSLHAVVIWKARFSESKHPWNGRTDCTYKWINNMQSNCRSSGFRDLERVNVSKGYELFRV